MVYRPLDRKDDNLPWEMVAVVFELAKVGKCWLVEEVPWSPWPMEAELVEAKELALVVAELATDWVT